MDFGKCTSITGALSLNMAPSFLNRMHTKTQFEEQDRALEHTSMEAVDVDCREIYFLIMHFLSSGPCQKAFGQLHDELLEHELLPRRYHAWYSRSSVLGGNDDDGVSLPLNYDNLVQRYSHIEKDHLVKLLKQLILSSPPPLHHIGRNTPSAADVPTLLGTGPFSLLSCDKNIVNKQVKHPPSYLRWPHMHADQVHGLGLREIGGGFAKHHRAPSMRFASYAIAKPSTMVQKMQNIKKLRGHRDAVYCAIFDRLGRYVITGSDDRLVKIWSMETAFCLASCRGHEGDITDLAVSSNNALVASSSNDYTIRVWRLPDGLPISVLRGHTGGVTAIAFSPRPSSVYQLLSSSDDGTCRVWDARYSQCTPRVYLPRPTNVFSGMIGVSRSTNISSSSNSLVLHQILCCAYNASGTVFVTGSSDRHARVWSAPKPNVDEPDQPSHEIDILSGHEQDVNYVQFSGCAVASRSSPPDSLVEDNIPKFRNSWFSHDNIVTCSRDGSAIIWIPKSRKSPVKAGRWAKAYHLKVPPPPMPPQPPRGGPRQRLLPTPRGVNMIVWSLDNRFVLAAIMDCRICVWNASDGSLVHSLTGHTQSTYVLDVHPFNPRIAMSAGYDGKTILWDIWEGTPIRTYEIGRFKLVDGKFSQDGTSIVLSDDVGQIYLLNTGQGESQKDAKYDQFFLGDYRPLIQDVHHTVIDQETQLAPYRRNMQDPLCDSSMLPYPEPYQSMYQRRRFGALGIEWRPPSINFAIGTDVGLGQEYQILPLADLDVVAEPLPEFLDAMNWEPEIDVINDDTDSEYNVNEDFSSEEKGHLSGSSCSDPDCSEDEKIRQSQNRRSKRKKSVSEVELVTSSGRRKRKRIMDRDVSSSKSRRTGKSKTGRKTASKKNSAKPKTLRPHRVATRNANNVFLHSDFSTGDEDDASSEDDPSESDSEKWSYAQSEESDGVLQNGRMKPLTGEEASALDEPPTSTQPQINVENKRRLVLKFSLRDAKKSLPSKVSNTQFENQTCSASSSLRVGEETTEDNQIKQKSHHDPGSASTTAIGLDSSENNKRGEYTEVEDLKISPKDMKMSEGYQDTAGGCGEVKASTSKQILLSDLALADSFNGSNESSINNNRSGVDIKEHTRPENGYGKLSADFGIQDRGHMLPGEQFKQRTSGCHLQQPTGNGAYNNTSDNFSPQVNAEKPKLKPTILKIKSRKISGELRTPSESTFTRPVDVSCDDDSRSCMERSRVLSLSETGNGTKEPDCLEHVNLEMENTINVSESSRKLSNDGVVCENTPKESNHCRHTSMDYPDAATDAARRKRSLRLKATSRDTNHVNLSKRTVDFFPSTGVSSSGANGNRSSRSKGEVSYNDEKVCLNSFTDVPRKSDWLLLSKQEEGYRYIPQLGDEVAYLRQGHQEYLESSGSSGRGPWEKHGARIQAVEICLVEELTYATVPGSGESCCKITLKFTDASSDVSGQKFKLTVPELNDFPDFIVEKSRYDAAMKRSWACKEECQVWWRDESEECGGRWWDGRIISVKDKSSEFPGSPWERYAVQYDGDQPDTHLHCPWELQDPFTPWEHPHIDPESNSRMLGALNKLLKRATTNQDDYGVVQLINVARKVDFMNRFAVPLSPDIIHSRLENKYYRSVEGLKHDVTVMLGNAKDYFGKNTAVAVKMKRLSDWFTKILSKL
ncbi:PREDICTED: PH-interacting protein [Ipomoea nil]|uniref:PH-interacting protein n=1 Tax=Ipomoea nil TaxID=35883 RepID=UPI000901DF13|nr:PREDICTED: PH-interacting protein [Ipomoea nil]